MNLAGHLPRTEDSLHEPVRTFCSTEVIYSSSDLNNDFLDNKTQQAGTREVYSSRRTSDRDQEQVKTTCGCGHFSQK